MAHDLYDLHDVTRRNTLYRKVLRTVPGQFQTVLMSLRPGETIPTETHPHTVQFFYIVSGRGKAVLSKRTRLLRRGKALTVLPGVEHTIRNTSKTQPLKLFTFYTPPEHPPQHRQRRQGWLR